MRLARVVGLLVALGALSGAFVGIVILLGWSLAGPAQLLFRPQAFAAAAALGAVTGSVMGPPIALSLLRRVPLWRATLHVAVAAGFGAVSGDLSQAPGGWLVWALVCALAMALLLRRIYRERSTTVQSL